MLRKILLSLGNETNFFFICCHVYRRPFWSKFHPPRFVASEVQPLYLIIKLVFFGIYRLAITVWILRRALLIYYIFDYFCETLSLSAAAVQQSSEAPASSEKKTVIEISPDGGHSYYIIVIFYLIQILKLCLLPWIRHIFLLCCK